MLLLFIFFPVPDPVYPTSTVLNDREGHLLSASIASDGQWRFPPADSIPKKSETCLLLFEDEYFYYHPGINPVSMVRAAWQNVRDQKTVSGASTLTMQIARMMRNKPRSFYQKMVEMLIALRLEIRHSKKELLISYASMAPFGGNVVGIDAASWRYFNRPAHLLSWAESATLAVLPNQPGAIYPGVESSVLRKKRDRLLAKLLSRSIIDSTTYQLSLAEPLPGEPFPVPQIAPHLLTTVKERQEGRLLNTTISPYWQSQTHKITERYHRLYSDNGIENLAALVVDLESGEVLSYVGNTSDAGSDGYQVDVIRKPRSSGSILKPLLYAMALDNGQLLPATLLPDIPTFFGGFTPKNFDSGYQGAVQADDALAMSLNIPFVYLLKDYTYERFHADLKNIGITTLSRSPGHYGLSLILGGAEVTLWDLAQVYFSLYKNLSGESNHSIHFWKRENEPLRSPGLEAITSWHTFNAMTKLTRPLNDRSWENFSSSQLLAWKTGTSFGFRDAWAVGLNGTVLVAVWVGNADGEGRAGLTGVRTAAPILTELMRLADHDPSWLQTLKPFAEEKEICLQSGMLANPYCPDKTLFPVGRKAEKSGLCRYHRTYWMDATGSRRVHSSCYNLSDALELTYFILPPAQGYYYKKAHADYQGVPGIYPGCEGTDSRLMEIIYPPLSSKVFIPRNLAENSEEVVLEASHVNTQATVYWHINEQYLGSTSQTHKLSAWLKPGVYLLTLIDDEGNRIERRFEVIGD